MFKAPITPIQNSKFKILLSEGSAKVQRRMSEGWAKESRRAGAAEYVKPVRLAPKESRRAGTAEYVKPVRLVPFSRHYHIKK